MRDMFPILSSLYNSLRVVVTFKIVNSITKKINEIVLKLVLYQMILRTTFLAALEIRRTNSNQKTPFELKMGIINELNDSDRVHYRARGKLQCHLNEFEMKCQTSLNLFESIWTSSIHHYFKLHRRHAQGDKVDSLGYVAHCCLCDRWYFMHRTE